MIYSSNLIFAEKWTEMREGGQYRGPKSCSARLKITGDFNFLKEFDHRSDNWQRPLYSAVIVQAV